jgi:enoyl-CoA hydratase/carnithine racemase
MTISQELPDLRVEQASDTWTLTLNRPDKRNALSATLVESLILGIEQAHQSGARLIVIKGEGKNLSAGFDFSGVEQQSEGDLLLRFVRIETMFQMLINSPAQTLCFAHGRNFGAGVDLFAACRERVSTADSSFYMPGLKFGLVLGTHRLASLVGNTAAQQLLLRAGPFLADEAQACGLVTQIAAQEAWAQVTSDARITASALEQRTQEHLCQVLRGDHADQSLAALVRSASHPGLKARIASYLQRPN